MSVCKCMCQRRLSETSLLLLYGILGTLEESVDGIHGPHPSAGLSDNMNFLACTSRYS